MTLTLTFKAKVMSRSHTPYQVLTTRNQACNSLTMNRRPLLIVVTVRPRVGFVTLTFKVKVKVIPRSNAPNDSKVFANMSEVLLNHA